MKLSKLQQLRADPTLQSAFAMILRQDAVHQRSGQIKYLTPYAQDKLKKDGYKVKFHSGREWPWTISWT